MARARIDNALSLDQWAEVMGINPYEMNQIGEGVSWHRDAQCDTVFFQFQWQRAFICREEIAQAIAKAESMIANYLGYWPAPMWFDNEVIVYPSDWRLQTVNWMTPRGTWKSVYTRYKHVQSVGAMKRTLVQANQALTLVDTFSNSELDAFSISIATTETDATKIACYFSTADRTALDETWRLRPLTVDITGTTLTITGKRYQLVKQVVTDVPNPEILDLGVAANFVTTLDIYRIESDSDDLGTADWDELVNTSSATSSDVSSASIVNSKQGKIIPTINAVFTQGRAPNRIRLNYLAGFPLGVDGRMREPYASMVSYLSTKYLPALKCGCDRADQILQFWRSTPTDNEQGKRPMTSEEINRSAFGVTRGALEAWRLAEQLQEPMGLRL